MVMPYHFEKGPWISILEDIANGAVDRTVLLEKLRDPSVRLVDIALTDHADAQFDTAGPLADRLNENWFGYDAAGNPQSPFSAADPHRTGYWLDYHGDVEGILREALTRSLEVAMGLTHEEVAAARRTWPIEMFWTCPRGWMECWVTWREHDVSDPTAGQVTLIIATPADSANPVRPEFGKPLHPEAGVQHVNPVTATGTQGMWVVAHEDHKAHWIEWIDPTQPVPDQVTEELVVAGLNAQFGGDVLVGVDDVDQTKPWPIPLPATMWEGVGNIVVVSPPEKDGGVSPSGRQYIPSGR